MPKVESVEDFLKRGGKIEKVELVKKPTRSDSRYKFHELEDKFVDYGARQDFKDNKVKKKIRRRWSKLKDCGFKTLEEVNENR